MAIKRHHIYLLLIIGLAFLVRIWDIGWNGFNGDESIYSGQGASLLGQPEFIKDFAIFRAHPLLFQSLVSLSFAIFGISDIAARIVPVLFGTLTVLFTYLVAKELFDKKVGLISSLVLALLPFHIVFSRQVILDAGLSFFVILFIYFITKYKKTGSSVFAFLTGISCGLCFLSKEIGIITLPIFFIYTIMTRVMTLSKAAIYLAAFGLTTSPFYLLVLTRQDAVLALFEYSTYQFSREGNVFSLLYSSVLVNEALGYALSILCVISIYLVWRDSKRNGDNRYWHNVLLLALSIGIIFLFIQLLSSKGDRFIMTLVPLGVILGCSFLVSDQVRHRRMHTAVYLVIVPVIILSNNFFLSMVFPVEDLKISDYQGTPWNRNVALWIKDNTPADAGVLTSESKLANIINFYSNRDVYTIKINRNPSYVQVDNPLFLILNNNVTVIVEDLAPDIYKTRAAGEIRKYISFLKPDLVHTEFKHERGSTNGSAVPITKVYRTN